MPGSPEHISSPPAPLNVRPVSSSACPHLCGGAEGTANTAGPGWLLTLPQTRCSHAFAHLQSLETFLTVVQASVSSLTPVFLPPHIQSVNTSFKMYPEWLHSPTGSPCPHHHHPGPGPINHVVPGLFQEPPNWSLLLRPFLS